MTSTRLELLRSASEAVEVAEHALAMAFTHYPSPSPSQGLPRTTLALP